MEANFSKITPSWKSTQRKASTRPKCLKKLQINLSSNIGEIKSCHGFDDKTDLKEVLELFPSEGITKIRSAEILPKSVRNVENHKIMTQKFNFPSPKANGSFLSPLHKDVRVRTQFTANKK